MKLSKRFVWGYVFQLIVLMVAAVAFAATASASSKDDAARLWSPRVFSLPPPQLPTIYTLTVILNPLSGGGSVTKDPERSAYISGTVVTLRAVPASNWRFDRWEVDRTGSANPTTITMVDSNKTVTAYFAQLPCFTLGTSSSPSAGGSVAVTAVNCPDGSTKYLSGTVVSLTATANPGYAFSTWSGDPTTSGNTNPTTILMNGNKNVTANFVTCYALNIVKSPTNGGTVGANPTPNCGMLYKSGTSVILTASVGSGYTFFSWSGCDSSSGLTCNVGMGRIRDVTAIFSAIQPTSQPAATSTSTPEPTSTSSPLATITPLLGGVVVATSTVAPTPSSSLPSTGGSPLILIVTGLVLVMIVIGARYMRQSSA